jgi:putative transposase
MKVRRAWKYRIYPSKNQENDLNSYLHNCKTLWNSLLEYTKKYYEETKNFPTKAQLCHFTKGVGVFSQVAQNVADKLVKSLKGMIAKKKIGKKAGFPRFKSFERMRSFTYPQFGFKLSDKLGLSGLGSIMIKKHRNIQGQIKTLTIKKSPSRKWFAIFNSELEIAEPKKKQKPKTGIDLGIEYFAYLSDESKIENPRHLKKAELRLNTIQEQLSKKKKGGKNRRKARLKVARFYEKVANTRRDFLHKTSKLLVDSFSFIAMENLNIQGLSKGFLAKHVLDCSWAEFLSMLTYKAVEAGCEVVLVNPAYTSQRCSSCGLVQKKTLAERWHECPCGTSLHRDLNAAKNILTRATHGQWGSNAWGEDSNSFLLEPRNPEPAKLTKCHISSAI